MIASLVCVVLASAFSDLERQDSDALQQHIAGFRAAVGVEARCAALDALASLTHAANPPSAEAVAAALAIALEDSSLRVQAHAVELMADTQAGTVALPALLESVRSLERRELQLTVGLSKCGVGGVAPRLAARCGRDPTIWNEVQQEIEKLTLMFESLRDLTAMIAVVGKDGEKRKKKALDEYDSQIALFRSAKAILEGVIDDPELKGALVAAFAKLRDDRSVEGLARILRIDRHGPCSESAVAGLIAFGTQPALDKLVDSIEDYGAERARRAKAESSLRKQKPRKKPDDSSSDEVWERRETERIKKEIESFEEHARAEDGWFEGLCTNIRGFAAAHDLDSAPTTVLPADAWRRWSNRARQKLPASLE